MSKENNYRRFSDEELVKAILEGDTDAYTEVMSRYKNMVYSVILHILSGDGDAEDIAQETFIDGFFRLGSLRDNTSLAPWLYGIAKRKALNHYTRRKHYVSYDSIEEGITGLPTGNSPEDYVIKNETACLVRKAISELSDKNRSVALLYYFENMPVSDIANRLGVSVGTVKSRLHEARNKLKGGLAFMTENNNQTNTQSKRNEDFDKILRAKLKQLEYYYALNGASFEGFDALLD
ncbi:MAG: RNA polymerase sigma factor, partial [Ruminococcaceae bacterium]|nr:RNA polymerase sigma factor [Oscillospiraceae bacterium]